MSPTTCVTRESNSPRKMRSAWPSLGVGGRPWTPCPVAPTTPPRFSTRLQKSCRSSQKKVGDLPWSVVSRRSLSARGPPAMKTATKWSGRSWKSAGIFSLADLSTVSHASSLFASASLATADCIENLSGCDAPPSALHSTTPRLAARNAFAASATHGSSNSPLLTMMRACGLSGATCFLRRDRKKQKEAESGTSSAATVHSVRE
mmetsp:Transcript_65535/g.174528  ORF Transcript_65535/g.174528 Transcript_65535/m.174528 type:complete len:204 (-) Transcript_65535:97-708(-)